MHLCLWAAASAAARACSRHLALRATAAPLGPHCPHHALALCCLQRRPGVLESDLQAWRGHRQSARAAADTSCAGVAASIMTFGWWATQFRSEHSAEGARVAKQCPPPLQSTASPDRDERRRLRPLLPCLGRRRELRQRCGALRRAGLGPQRWSLIQAIERSLSASPGQAAASIIGRSAGLRSPLARQTFRLRAASALAPRGRAALAAWRSSSRAANLIGQSTSATAFGPSPGPTSTRARATRSASHPRSRASVAPVAPRPPRPQLRRAPATSPGAWAQASPVSRLAAEPAKPAAQRPWAPMSPSASEPAELQRSPLGHTAQQASTAPLGGRGGGRRAGRCFIAAQRSTTSTHGPFRKIANLCRCCAHGLSSAKPWRADASQRCAHRLAAAVPFLHRAPYLAAAEATPFDANVWANQLWRHLRRSHRRHPRRLGNWRQRLVQSRRWWPLLLALTAVPCG